MLRSLYEEFVHNTLRFEHDEKSIDYSNDPNKRAGPNKRAWWKIGQN